MKFSVIEVFLFQIVVYILLWLWDDFIGLFLTITFSTIAFLILVVAIISEMIERSKVPKSYFLYMISAILAPILVLIAFYLINGSLPDLSII